MTDRRSLRLRKDTLAQLGGSELRAVQGGSHLCGVTDTCTHGPSLDAACPTTPVLVCLSFVTRDICA